MFTMHPTKVCLCGSTRFGETFQKANLDETLKGNIVLSIGCDMRADADLFAEKTEDERIGIKKRLDTLHLRKIDLADEVLILNVGGYVGESTRREFEYAQRKGKTIRWLEPDKALPLDAEPPPAFSDPMLALEVRLPNGDICIVDSWKYVASVIEETWYGEDWKNIAEVGDRFRIDVIQIEKEEFANLEPYEP